MVRENQLDICRVHNTYFCRPCDRPFNTYHGALNHCQNARVHQDEWCERCRRLFVSSAAYRTHLDNSSHHNVCDPCHLDFRTSDRLESHDVAVHNMCIECGKYFENGNNLMQHKRSHLPADIQCLGCFRQFSEFSAMIIHLESGNCESGLNRDDIDSWIFDSFVTSPYVSRWTDYYRYKCPECESDFVFLSALCQHVASNACDQDPKSTFDDVERCINWR
ncbi:uncharacterized protein A1O5_02345, partial [Cladophialophora psammophila CBS 110553]